jgi:hypothetical protein
MNPGVAFLAPAVANFAGFTKDKEESSVRYSFWIGCGLALSLVAGCATTAEPQQQGATTAQPCEKSPPVTGSNIPRRDPCARAPSGS